MHSTSVLSFIVLVCNCVRGYPNVWAPPTQLNPVHGLYVKPSTDGVTGDLYVAATEDNGMKQWVVDQPISFLPAPTATAQAQPVAVTYPGYQTSHGENPQKRAVVPTPAPNQPVQYAYAIPVPSSNQDTPVAAYPCAYPTAAPTTESSNTNCESSQTAPQYPYQLPYQYFYPQLMSAYTNALSLLKEAGLSDDTASSVMAHHTSTWPSSYPYAYPMYVMAVDPSTWAQNQATTTSTTTTTPSPESEESTQGDK